MLSRKLFRSSFVNVREQAVSFGLRNCARHEAHRWHQTKIARTIANNPDAIPASIPPFWPKLAAPAAGATVLVGGVALVPAVATVFKAVAAPFDESVGTAGRAEEAAAALMAASAAEPVLGAVALLAG